MPNQISRRQVLQGTAAVAGVLPIRAALAADTVIGFIYVGSRDDYGYNQAHAAGAAALKKVAVSGVTGVRPAGTSSTMRPSRTTTPRSAASARMLRGSLIQSARFLPKFCLSVGRNCALRPLWLASAAKPGSKGRAYFFTNLPSRRRSTPCVGVARSLRASAMAGGHAALRCSHRSLQQQ